MHPSSLTVALALTLAACAPATPDPTADTDLAWRIDAVSLRAVEPASLVATAPERITLHLDLEGTPEGAPLHLTYAGETIDAPGPLTADGDGYQLRFIPPALPPGTTGSAPITLRIADEEVSGSVRLRLSPDALTLPDRADGLMLPRMHRPAMGWMVDLAGDGTPYHLVIDLGPPSATSPQPIAHLQVVRCAASTCTTEASIPLPEATNTAAGALHTDQLRLHTPLGDNPTAFLFLPLACPSAEPCGEHAAVAITLTDTGEVEATTTLLESDDYQPGDPQHLSVTTESGDVPMLLTLTRTPLQELPGDPMMKILLLGPRQLARTTEAGHSLIDALHPESNAMLDQADVVDFCPSVVASGRPGSLPDGVIFGVDTAHDLLYFGRLVRPNTPLQAAHLPSAAPGASCPEPARPRCVAEDFDGDGMPDAIFEVPDEAGCPVLMFSRSGPDGMSDPIVLLKSSTQAGDDALTRKRPGRFSSGNWSASATEGGTLLTLMAELPSQILLDLSGDAPALVEALPAASGLHRSVLQGSTPVSPPHSLTDAGGRASTHAAAEHLVEATQIAARPPKRHPGPSKGYTKTTTVAPWQQVDGLLQPGAEHSEVSWSEGEQRHTLTELDACPLADATLVPTIQGARLVCTDDDGASLTDLVGGPGGIATSTTRVTFDTPTPHSAAWISSSADGAVQRALLSTRRPQPRTFLKDSDDAGLYLTGPLRAGSPVELIDLTEVCGGEASCASLLRDTQHLDVAPIALGGDALFLLRQRSDDACGPAYTVAVLHADGSLSPVEAPNGQKIRATASGGDHEVCGSTNHLRVGTTDPTCSEVTLHAVDLTSGRKQPIRTTGTASLDASWMGAITSRDLDGDGCPELLNRAGDVLQNHCDCTYGPGPTLSPKAAGLSLDDAFVPIDDLVPPAQDYNSSRSNRIKSSFGGPRDPDDDGDGLLTTYEAMPWPFFDGLTCPTASCP